MKMNDTHKGALMKIRCDYVTNSSSSSFILAYKNKDEAIKDAKRTRMESDAREILLNDIINTIPCTKKKIDDILMDECKAGAVHYLEFGDGDWWCSQKDTWESTWRRNNPGKQYRDMIESPEYKKAVEEKTKEYVSEVKKRIGDLEYVLYMEYSDEDGSVYGDLEHEIMPKLIGTVKRFSHH